MNTIENEIDYPLDNQSALERFSAMLERGINFIETGSDFLLGTDSKKNEHGLIAIGTGLDLLFRAKLVQTNWALEFENIDNPKQEERLSFDRVLNRLIVLRQFFDYDSIRRNEDRDELFLALRNFNHCKYQLSSERGLPDIEALISVVTRLMNSLVYYRTWEELFPTDEKVVVPKGLISAAEKLSARTMARWSSIREKVLNLSTRKFIFRCPHCHQTAGHCDYMREPRDCSPEDYISHYFRCEFCNTSTSVYRFESKIFKENIVNPPVLRDSLEEIYKVCDYQNDANEQEQYNNLESALDCYGRYRAVTQHRLGCSGVVLGFEECLYVCCCCGKRGKQLANWECYNTEDADAYEEEVIDDAKFDLTTSE
jgi:hypothetical protein